jgi:Mg-chelatase subunit ChlD
MQFKNAILLAAMGAVLRHPEEASGSGAATAASRLSEYDYVVVLDGSGSMGETDGQSRSRWQRMQEQVEQFTRDVSALDSDGIGVVLFNGGKIESWDGVTPDKVKEIFAGKSPRGSTPMTEALAAALKLAGKSAKKDFICVFTDGVPDNPTSLKELIVNTANQSPSDDALTILFAQQGADREATAFLQHLDDGLKGAKYDIVDAKTAEEVDQFPSTTALIEAAIVG